MIRQELKKFPQAKGIFFNNCLNVPINLKCFSSVVIVIYDFSMQNLFGVKKSKGIWAPGVSHHRDLKILWELR